MSQGALNAEAYLTTIIVTSEAIGRIGVEAARVHAEVVAADKDQAALVDAYCEQRQQFIAALGRASGKADFDSLVPDFHQLINAGIAINAAKNTSAKLHRKSRELTDEMDDLVFQREKAFQSQCAIGVSPPPPRAATPPPAKLDAAQATRLALEAEQELLGKPHAPRLPDRADTSTIQAEILAVVTASNRPMAVAAVHQHLADRYSLQQVRDGLSILYRLSKLSRVERGIYKVSQGALSAR